MRHLMTAGTRFAVVAALVAALTSCSSTGDAPAWGASIAKPVARPPARGTAAAQSPPLGVATQDAPVAPSAMARDPTVAVPKPRLTRITSCFDSALRGSVWQTEVRISADGKFVAFLAELETGLFGLGDRVDRLVVYDVDAAKAHPLELEYGGRKLLPVHRDFELSADGRWLAFVVNEKYWDDPSNTEVFVCDWRAGTVEPIDVHRYGVEPEAGPVELDFSDDMSRVVIMNRMKEGGVAGCLVIDRPRDEAHLLAPPEGGAAVGASLSGDGRIVAFVNNLSSSDPFYKPRGLWVHDLRSQRYELLPLDQWVDADAVDMLSLFDSPRISRSGRYIALLGSLTGARQMPRAALLVDRSAERVSVISRDEEGLPVEAPSYGAKPCDGGDCVLFISNADLTGYDWNKHFDIFRYDCRSGRLEQVSMDALHRTGDKWSFESDMSEDGRSIVFWSRASNLVPDDRNELPDIFLWQR